MREVNITFGPPGTGKTTAMLNKVEGFIKQGIAPQRIAFVSYTKKAVTEAAERAADKFGLSRKQFRNFRTLHSTAYHSLNVTRNEVMGNSDYKEVAGMLGVTFTGYGNIADGVAIGDDTGDYMLQLVNLANATGQPLRDVWASTDITLDWYRLKQFADTLTQYKGDMFKIDFDDMLANFVKARPLVDVDAVVIDEAQDLSNTQWNVAKVAFRQAKHIEIAGDDDQAIYAWNGANVERFLGVAGNKTVLEQSYRLPRTAYTLANNIIKQVGTRYDKQWLPRANDGAVHHLNASDQAPIGNGEDWLLLARNGYQLSELEDTCVIKGVPYVVKNKSSVDLDHVRAITLWGRLGKGTELQDEEMEHVHAYTKCRDYGVKWFDALTGINLATREYYLSCLRNGHRLQDTPKVHINTIHGVKGGEATNVLLKTDMSYKTYNSMQVNPDNEHRVFYVGATRTKENLFVIQPETDRGYLI